MANFFLCMILKVCVKILHKLSDQLIEYKEGRLNFWPCIDDILNIDQIDMFITKVIHKSACIFVIFHSSSPLLL